MRTPTNCLALWIVCLGPLLCAACAGSGGGREPQDASSAAVVPVEELPARHLRVLSAYGAGGAEWEATREEVRADPALARFMIDNLVVEMVRAHDALVGADAARARLALDRSRAELVRLAPESVPTLVELFAVGDDVVSEQVAEALREMSAPEAGAASAASRLLKEPEVRARRRAARLLGDLSFAGGDEPLVMNRLAAALGDEDWAVRAEAARALGRRASRGREMGAPRRALERALNDPDPAVARCAAEGLGFLEDPAAVPALAGALQRAAQAGDYRLLTAAKEALRLASGDPVERDPAGWQRWWSEHGAQIQARSRAPAR